MRSAFEGSIAFHGDVGDCISERARMPFTLILFGGGEFPAYHSSMASVISGEISTML